MFCCKWYLRMILKNINIFSQNVYKNNLLTNTILEAQTKFNIIFIQELPWSFIRSISSSSNREGDKLVGVPNYSYWINFSRNPSNPNNSPRIITYINIQLANLCFTLCKDIFNYRDVLCISFFNCGFIYLFAKYLFQFVTIGLKVSQGY